MSGDRIVSLHNPWFTASVAITAAIAVVAAVVGFGGLWLASRDSPPPDHRKPAE